MTKATDKASINCIGYYETVPFQPGTLRTAITNLVDGEGQDDWLHRVFFDADDHNTVYVDFNTVGPFGTPQSDHFFRFAFIPEPYQQSYLVASETFDGAITFEPLDDDGLAYGVVDMPLVDDAAEFIRDWVVTA